MQRDHLFNRSNRPLLSRDDSSCSSKNYSHYHSSSVAATIVPKKHGKAQLPSNTDYKLHGFNDFNFVANQYKNFSNKHSGYPYGSPPASPTTSIHQHQQPATHAFNDSSDVNYYDDDSGCHTNNSSDNFSCRSNYSPAAINYYEDAPLSLGNDYQSHFNGHHYHSNDYASLPVQTNEWNGSAKNYYKEWPRFGSINNGHNHPKITNSNNGARNAYQQQPQRLYNIGNKIESIAPSPVNQFVDNGPFIFGVHSNACYTLAGKINNENTVIKSTTATTPVLGTKYKAIDPNEMHRHPDDNDENDIYRRCDVAIIDGNSSGNNNKLDGTAAVPKTEPDRRQAKNAPKTQRTIKKDKIKAPKKPQKSGNEIKCVVVGDGTVGKTNLILAYLQHRFTTEHVPTASDIYNFEVKVDESPVQVTLCDTAGQDFLDPLRRLCYPDSDVFLLCFSVIQPETFVSVREKWAPIFRKSQTPIVLIGTQADLRSDPDAVAALSAKNEKPVSKSDAWDYATLIGAKYIETSSRANQNVKEAFDTAIWHALMSANQRKKPSLWKRLLCLT